MRRVAIASMIACVAVGCAKQETASTILPDPVRPLSEHKHGPAEKDTSIAAGLAEEFMKTQPNATRYSSTATAVFQDEIGVYIVKFQLLDNSSKNHALVHVVLKDKRCERIPDK